MKHTSGLQCRHNHTFYKWTVSDVNLYGKYILCDGIRWSDLITWVAPFINDWCTVCSLYPTSTYLHEIKSDVTVYGKHNRNCIWWEASSILVHRIGCNSICDVSFINERSNGVGNNSIQEAYSLYELLYIYNKGGQRPFEYSKIGTQLVFQTHYMI